MVAHMLVVVKTNVAGGHASVARDKVVVARDA